MSYRIRFTMPDGRTGLWAHEYKTRETAQAAIDDRLGDTGFAYAVEEVHDAPKPTSTTERLVGLLRDLAFAIQLGNAMREAMRTGEWRAGHDRSMASYAISGWDRWKTGLAASVQGTAKASEEPAEGGDSDRRRLEALERFIKGKYCESIIWQGNAFGAISEIVAIEAPTLASLADKIMEMEVKP